MDIYDLMYVMKALWVSLIDHNYNLFSYEELVHISTFLCLIEMFWLKALILLLFLCKTIV